MKDENYDIIQGISLMPDPNGEDEPSVGGEDPDDDDEEAEA